MNKLLMFLSFLVLLLAPLSSTGQDLSDTFEIFAKLHDMDAGNEEGEDDSLEAIDLPSWHSHHSNKNLINVEGFGAVGDGVADDTQAFTDAWKQACSTPKSVLLVPEGRRYLVNATRFRGPCLDKVVIQIEGTIVAPDDPNSWDPKNPRTWLVFNNLTKVYFQGKGVIDGSGTKWWAASCKKNKSNPCKSAPTALTIDSSSAVRVKGITVQNGQQMNFVIGRSDSVRVIDVKVSAPEDSPNTDGIHITESTNVVLQNCKIGTGDDCISIVNASSNIKMKNIFCGPGHGISIGSLGKENTTCIVESVVVDKAFLRGTTNGLRIKTWQGGSGYVRAVRYQDVRMEDVTNPIIIDQFYCDSPKSCQNQVRYHHYNCQSIGPSKTSAVNITQIMYRNIAGTSRSQKAMKFACSDTIPCTHIILNNINLQRSDGTVETYCNSAAGIGYGYINPSAECLSSSDKDAIIVQPNTQHIVHTEL
ncbi:galacturonan 1,4-alpha-galacturonidase [Salvia divinorum]|uniref:endo-polygalacturonase n=1 Tax=Salvia divinorum TaxID=28513 RepID=A0ABD1FTT8_SALDI